MTWSPINLALLGEREAVAPTISGLAYPGRRHVWSGPPESAKTLAAYIVSLEHIRAGGTVAVIDFEMGPYDARDRLRDLGATPSEFAQLLYIEPDSVKANEDILAHLVSEFTPTLVVVDAAAGAYELQELDDNKRVDAELFARALINPLWQQGVASIVLDHVTKNGETRGRYAIGSERKIGGADVHLGFDAIVPLGRGRTGLVKITTHKDRLGYLPRPRAAELELRSDPTTHRIAWTFREATPDSEDGDTWKPSVLMVRVSEYLQAQDGAVSRNAIETSVTGKRDYVRQAMDELLAGGYVSEQQGARGSRLLQHVRPFTSPDLAPTSPRATSTTSPLRPPSIGGEVGEVNGPQGDDIAQGEVERLFKDHADVAGGAA